MLENDRDFSVINRRLVKNTFKAVLVTLRKLSEF